MPLPLPANQPPSLEVTKEAALDVFLSDISEFLKLWGPNGYGLPKVLGCVFGN